MGELELATIGFVENAQCREVQLEDITEEHIQLTKDMLRYSADLQTQALSAIQVGVKLKFFTYWDRHNTATVVYNPKYYKNGNKAPYVEDSFTYGKAKFAIQRWKRVRAVWQVYDPDTKSLVSMSKNLSGINSALFQHHTDMLNGKAIGVVGKLVSFDV